MKPICAVCFFALVIIAYAPDALALPRFAAQTGSKCQSCHINPAGGGMRNAFGAQFGREELPVPQWSEEAGLEDVTKLLPSFLGVGADFQTLYLVRQIPDSTGTGSSLKDQFWQMQGDIYFNFRIGKRINLYFMKGLYSGFEAYGLLNLLPWKGYLKIGKFVPNYGMRLDDHTTFIRTYTGFSPEGRRPELTGIEAAVSPGPMTVSGGVYNAADGFGGTAGSEKSYLGRAEGLFGITKDMHAGIGANVFHRQQTSGSTTLYGGFGSFNAGNLTLLGEGDLLRSTFATRSQTGVLVYGEADYTIVDGVDLLVAYDFYDPDKDIKSGTLTRYSIGVSFIPFGGVEVRPVYRILVEDPVNEKNNELHVLFHIYL
jgi:hypothetical protein